MEPPDEPINDIKVYHPTSGYSTLPDFLSSFKGSGERPVYIGFGSMEELGFFSSIDCVELLAALNEGNSLCKLTTNYRYIFNADLDFFSLICMFLEIAFSQAKMAASHVNTMHKM